MGLVPGPVARNGSHQLACAGRAGFRPSTDTPWNMAGCRGRAGCGGPRHNWQFRYVWQLTRARRAVQAGQPKLQETHRGTRRGHVLEQRQGKASHDGQGT